MMTIAIIQARMGSSRLPGKVLADLGGRPVLDRVTASARLIPGVDRVVVATSDQSVDEPIAAWCSQNNVAVFRGSENDVLQRFAETARTHDADIVLRLTADCPLLDPMVCGHVLALLQDTDSDYASNVAPSSWPDGLDCEALTAAALHDADTAAVRQTDREHVTPYIRNNRSRFQVAYLPCPLPSLSGERWTLDDEHDLAFLRQIIKQLPELRIYSYLHVLDVLRRRPDLRDLNGNTVRNAGYAAAIGAEALTTDRSYAGSQAFFERARKVVPLGSQTFSKSCIQYPDNAAPLFLSHGQGGRVWDIDGNEYVDLVGGLLPVVLGYCDPDIDDAVREQLARGASFSLATKLETELAERLIDTIPCAEMVRFGKNGSDATLGAVRVARAKTGRDRIIKCGYHGWHDWTIGTTTRNKGVPRATSDLTHAVPFNDLDAVRSLLERHTSEFAALILEPMTVEEPKPGYLSELKTLLHRHGALLIYDEVITGFRFHLGGAQSLFGVTPDLAAFGKAMGNGLPISAVVGRADLMAEMEEIFFSSTFGGEALSLAAAIAVIDKMQREPVIERLWQTGERLAEQADQVIAENGLADVMALRGKAPWMIFEFRDHAKAHKDVIKTYFLREMLRAGILVNASHNVCYAHGDGEVVQVKTAYDHVLPALAERLNAGRLDEAIGGKPIQPVFRVR